VLERVVHGASIMIRCVPPGKSDLVIVTISHRIAGTMTAGARDVLIRMLHPDDAVAYHAQRIRALREHPEAFGRTPEEVDSVEIWADRLRDDLHGENDLMLGAFEGGELIGVAGVYRERAVKHRHVAYLWGVYVVPERRGRDVGRRLVTEAIARVSRWPDLEYLWLDVNTVNAPARTLYASLGFTGAAVKPRSLKVGDRYYDEELMVLDLTSARTG
jgi:RimJ/RimL family protein N-acetyltransferase